MLLPTNILLSKFLMTSAIHTTISQSAKLGLFTSQKNPELIVQYQSLPQELHGITFAEVSRILC